MIVPKTRVGFSRLAISTLVLSLLVILWGAFTRLSGSGDGCGENWPLCHGAIFPRSASLETAIEFMHRLSSGAVFLLALVLAWGARRNFSSHHPARYAAYCSFGFMVIEAGIGAVLVLYGWVDQNQSLQRIVSLTLHLVNTFFLVSSLSLTAHFARVDSIEKFSLRSKTCALILLGFFLLCLSGVAGVVAALSSMLHPFPSLWAGVQADFESSSPLLVRLRILHPLISVISVGYLFWLLTATRSSATFALRAEFRVVHRMLWAVLCAQVTLGAVTLVFGKVLVLKLMHLLVADVTVAIFAVFGALALSQVTAVSPSSGREADLKAHSHRPSSLST